ncbi:MAG: hypothetical protein B6D61_14510, partial [Bacteroidetes bacterium 4484_249]
MAFPIRFQFKLLALDDGEIFVTNGYYLLITLISGFTITNGLTEGSGGGVFCSCTIPRIYDCVISGNTAGTGGGIRQGDIRRCIITGNKVDDYGGGACSADLNNCTVVGNSARCCGGGVAFCNVNNSVISGNSANDYAGGAFDGTLNNCTITKNSAVNYGGGTHRATVNNSIVRYNYAAWSTNRDVGTYNYCCTTPDATNGIGNITAEPMLISLSHIATNSPCIGAGFSNYRPSQNIWTFDDGTAETNKLQVSHIWNSLGEYNVVLTAFNETYSNGISASLVIKVVTNINYVNVNNTSPVEPYDSWGTAATNIYDAVDISINGGTIIITNGVYVLSSQITVDKNISIRSVNGAENTIIDGNNSNRCFYLYNDYITISGLTILNGNAINSNGGGLYCRGTNPVIRNCTIANNHADSTAGGIYKGTICSSEITGNSAVNAGGTYNSVVNNSTIIRNLANNNGGGTYGGAINNSIIYYNSAKNDSNRHGGTYNYCCTTSEGTNGIGNISSEPILLSDSHIATNSPCIGAGSASYTSGVDIDGEEWKSPPSIGCDEVYANAISGSLSVAIIADETNACINWSLTFRADIKGKLYQNIWTFDDGTIETNKIQIIHSWNSTGDYNVALTAFNDTYPSGVSASTTIHVIRSDHFVNISNTNPILPYVSWETAATNIQDAVDVVFLGGRVFVTNGYYLLKSQIDVDNSITIQSVNGAKNTVIDGNYSNRCFNLYNHKTIISGFTITNGNAKNEDGGGIHCSGATPVIKNCEISGNIAHLYGGGVYRGTIYNCIIKENYAEYGGGIYYGTANNCLIFKNSAHFGGGTCGMTNNNCTIIENIAIEYGGGVHGSICNNSIVYYNFAPTWQNESYSTLNYCCTTPEPSSGTGNISVEPKLVSLSHIATNSPCIGAGSADYISGVDIDGEKWKNPPSIGCDEVYANAISGSLYVTINTDKMFTYIGNPLTFWANINGKLYRSHWSFGDGITEENKYKSVHSWNSTGEYEVILTAYNVTYPNGVSATNIINVMEDIHYVNAYSLTPVLPYETWGTAATNIQNAVDVAAGGGTIFVTNGLYLLSSQIDVDKNLSIKSINGAENTIIDGNNTNRCLNLHNYEVEIVGFTITNGCALADHGGGIYCSGINPVISKCIITKNSARRLGGGIYKGTIKNSLICNNSADKGGAGFSSRFYNCTIIKNSASSSGGATFYGYAYNSIIYYNLAPNYPNARQSEYYYCCTTPDSMGGTGNITAPPQFADTNSFDYRLKSTSPCINSGNNSYAPMPWDLDGNPRIFDDTVDMGCYESPFSVPRIASDALIFPADGSELVEDDFTDIIWNVGKITDTIDSTNLTITKISLLDANSSNKVANITNNVSNLIGEMFWLIPADLADLGGSYVLKFEVVNSSSITNSRIFTDSEFAIIP